MDGAQRGDSVKYYGGREGNITIDFRNGRLKESEMYILTFVDI